MRPSADSGWITTLTFEALLSEYKGGAMLSLPHLPSRAEGTSPKHPTIDSWLATTLDLRHRGPTFLGVCSWRSSSYTERGQSLPVRGTGSEYGRLLTGAAQAPLCRHSPRPTLIATPLTGKDSPILFIMLFSACSIVCGRIWCMGVVAGRTLARPLSRGSQAPPAGRAEERRRPKDLWI